VGRRLVSVSEDVYRRLSKLAVERNKTINDIIEELLNNYEGKVSSNSVLETLSEVKDMLRDCLSRLGVRRSAENKPVETKPEANSGPEAGGVGGFEDNPWVQILRVRYGSQSDRLD
jgi:Ribbon-helix-helix protein, copG family.